MHHFADVNERLRQAQDFAGIALFFVWAQVLFYMSQVQTLGPNVLVRDRENFPRDLVRNGPTSTRINPNPTPQAVMRTLTNERVLMFLIFFLIFSIIFAFWENTTYQSEFEEFRNM